jgi:hypothetical protein
LKRKWLSECDTSRSLELSPEGGYSFACDLAAGFYLYPQNMRAALNHEIYFIPSVPPVEKLRVRQLGKMRAYSGFENPTTPRGIAEYL